MDILMTVFVNWKILNFDTQDDMTMISSTLILWHFHQFKIFCEQSNNSVSENINHKNYTSTEHIFNSYSLTLVYVTDPVLERTAILPILDLFGSIKLFLGTFLALYVCNFSAFGYLCWRSNVSSSNCLLTLFWFWSNLQC